MYCRFLFCFCCHFYCCWAYYPPASALEKGFCIWPYSLFWTISKTSVRLGYAIVVVVVTIKYEVMQYSEIQEKSWDQEQVDSTCNLVALQRKSPWAIFARYNTLLRLSSTIHECTQQLITASKGTVCCWSWPIRLDLIVACLQPPLHNVGEARIAWCMARWLGGEEGTWGVVYDLIGRG